MAKAGYTKLSEHFGGAPKDACGIFPAASSPDAAPADDFSALCGLIRLHYTPRGRKRQQVRGAFGLKFL